MFGRGRSLSQNQRRKSSENETRDNVERGDAEKPEKDERAEVINDADIRGDVFSCCDDDPERTS